MSGDKVYWMCIIGPSESSKVKYGSDFPLRNSLQREYYNLVGEAPEYLASGWGISQEKYELIQKAWNMDVEELKNKLK